MIQFDIHRFGKLAKWSLVNDKKYLIKSFLQVFAIFVFLFLFFTYVMSRESVRSSINAYETCSIAVMILFGVTCVVGSSFMFYSMEGKHDMQNLMMLPASNFEIYLMRYASWILLLPLYLVAFLGADVLQYVVNLMVGHEHVTFVTSTLVDSLSRLFQLDVHSHLRHTFLTANALPPVFHLRLSADGGGLLSEASRLHSQHPLGQEIAADPDGGHAEEQDDVVDRPLPSAAPAARFFTHR